MADGASDIRIMVGFPDHPKVEKLVRLTNEGAVRCLLRLWGWAADNRPKGVLTGLDAIDISVISKWTGKDADWIAACMLAGLLDGCGEHSDPYRLHDWEEHQPYVFNRDKRVAQAKKAAAAKWDKRFKDDAGSNADSNAGSNADSNAPAPPPSPSPKGGRGADAANAQKGAASESYWHTKSRLENGGKE